MAHARLYDIGSSTFFFTLQSTERPCPEQFDGQSSIAGGGGYIKSEKDVQVTISVSAIDPLGGQIISTKTRSVSISQDTWTAFGIHTEIDNAAAYESVNLEASVSIEAPRARKLSRVQFFGVNLDTVTAFTGQAIRDHFDMKTDIYIPSIYYYKEDQAFLLEPSGATGAVDYEGDGEQLVLKACNRCARFLLIDVFSEHNALGFSNHCVQRAPCLHDSFSRYTIENATEENIDPKLIREGIVANVDGSLVANTHYGFQLECRSCKKFKVNAPLNPMRDTTQHKEDSLRRRAFEQLVRQLLGLDWIFFTHRQQYGSGFDIYIWEKFGKRCFGCGKKLGTPNDMNLDHTLPLNYLWPLDDMATCLCATCNSQKNNKFPFEFYQDDKKLEELASITGLDITIISERKRHANMDAVNRLHDQIVWFFDTFLMEQDYQKVRQGKKVADLVVASLHRVFQDVGIGWNPIEEYFRVTGRYPSSISLTSLTVVQQRAPC